MAYRSWLFNLAEDCRPILTPDVFYQMIFPCKTSSSCFGRSHNFLLRAVRSSYVNVRSITVAPFKVERGFFVLSSHTARRRIDILWRQLIKFITIQLVF